MNRESSDDADFDLAALLNGSDLTPEARRVVYDVIASSMSKATCRVASLSWNSSSWPRDESPETSTDDEYWPGSRTRRRKRVPTVPAKSPQERQLRAPTGGDAGTTSQTCSMGRRIRTGKLIATSLLTNSDQQRRTLKLVADRRPIVAYPDRVFPGGCASPVQQ